MYKIIITNRALKDIKTLDIETKKIIGQSINTLAENPTTNSKKLSNPKLGSYRMRVGNYRIIFDIDDDTIAILRVGHRSKIYRT